MERPEALKALDNFRAVILKDGYLARKHPLVNNDKYHWVYHIHLGRTYRQRHPFKGLDVDTEQPYSGGDSEDPFPATQPADPISDLWGGSGGADEHSSPPGLLGTYHNPIPIPDSPVDIIPSLAGTEACEKHSSSLHSILQQGPGSTGGPLSGGARCPGYTE